MTNAKPDHRPFLEVPEGTRFAMATRCDCGGVALASIIDEEMMGVTMDMFGDPADGETKFKTRCQNKDCKSVAEHPFSVMRKLVIYPDGSNAPVGPLGAAFRIRWTKGGPARKQNGPRRRLFRA